VIQSETAPFIRGSTEIIVTGGRDYKDAKRVQEVLTLFYPKTIIQGGAKGADHLARMFASEFNLKCVSWPADWDQWGKAAGPRRNKEMILAHPNAIVVAFPGGAGTENCVEFAIRQKRLVLRVEPQWT